MVTLRRETPEDWWEVEALYDSAFGHGRMGLSSYRLREGVAPVAALCLVEKAAGAPISGAIRYWPVRAGGEDALLLGPVAVHPTRQGEGIGALLIAQSLEAAQTMGWDWVILVGDAPYYARFGFSKDAARDIRFPPPTNPERLLAQALNPGAPPLSGPVTRAV